MDRGAPTERERERGRTFELAPPTRALFLVPARDLNLNARPFASGDPANGMRLPRDGNVGPLPPMDDFDQYAPRACERLGVTYDEAEAAQLRALWERFSDMERPMRMHAPGDSKMACDAISARSRDDSLAHRP